ncbi:hypothetical protein D3C71_1531890 [compost metagenome]
MLHQAGNAVGELDLAAHAAWLVADLVEHAGREDVAACHAHARGGYVGLGLFHDAFNADQRAASGLAGHDAVFVDLVFRHFLHRDDRAALLAEGGGHLGQHGLAAWGAHHQVVGQQHGKGLLAHQRLGAQHGVAQAQRAGLAHKGAVHVVGLYRPDKVQ